MHFLKCSFNDDECIAMVLHIVTLHLANISLGKVQKKGGKSSQMLVLCVAGNGEILIFPFFPTTEYMLVEF